MSKILATLATTLLVLPLLGHPAFAAKNIGGFGASGGRLNAASTCTVISVPVWQCPPGDSPSNWPNTKCKLVMVDQTVCHAA
jgi:hypothetical protein